MNRKRSGFSLVLSLAIMAGMVMLVIVLAAFLQVETRLALGHSGYMRARLNAIASAKMALGQLQQLAGPDQRVTMRADMYDAGDPPKGTYSTTVPQTGSGDMVYNPSAPKDRQLSHQKRYWTGVWATGGVDSTKVRDWDVMNPHKSRLFLGWLSSPCYITTSEPFDTAEYKNPAKPLPNYLPNRSYFTPKSQADGVSRNELTNLTSNDGQVLIDDLANNISDTPDATLVPLLSRGSVKFPAVANTSRGALEYYGQVDALPVPLPGPNSTVSSGINGRYAFWIGDEGIKAKANLPDAYATVKSDGSGYSNLITDWDDGFRGSAAQRNAIELINGKHLKDASVFPSGFSWGTWRTNDVSSAKSWDSTTIARVKDRGSLILWANTSTIGSTSGGEAMKEGYKALFHDVTPWSYSTIADNYNGGIKSDLSTAFELPYIVYRGLEMFYGQKNSTDSYIKKASLFHDADFAAIGGSTGAVGELGAIDFNHPNLLTLDFGDPVTLINTSPRASEWAPAFTSSVLGSSYSLLLSQNGKEVPERMGFVYEVPLRSAFFGGKVEREPNLKLQSGFATNGRGSSRIQRGPTWDLYRNYYRMYKREIEACTQVKTILNQPKSSSDAVFSRGCDPLSYSTGETTSKYSLTPYGYLETGGTASNIASRYNLRSEDGGAQYSIHQKGDSSKSYYPNGSSSGAVSGKIPTMPWQTSMKVAPSVVRLSMLYSAVWTDKHLGIAVDPLIVVHNPYDCAIEFTGISLITSEKEASHIFEFYYQPPNGEYTDPATGVTESEVNPSIVQIGDVFPAQTYELNHQISFRAIAGPRGTATTSEGKGDGVFRLEPGEVRLIGATDGIMATIDAYGSIDIPCDFAYTQSSQMFIPMDAYAVCVGSKTGMKYKAAAVTDSSVDIDPTKLSDYSRLSKTPASNPKLLKQQRILELVIKYTKQKTNYWDGSVNMFNTISGGRGIAVKVRNQSGPNFSGGASGYFHFPTPQYDASGTFIDFNKRPRGSGHVVNGGSQEFAFYLQYDTSPKGQNLNKYRRWMGPLTKSFDDSPTTYDSTLAANSCIANNKYVNEPVVLSLRTVTAGWPHYGNAGTGYSGTKFGPADPEFGVVDKGFEYGDANYPAISGTLPDVLGGDYTKVGPWKTITKVGSDKVSDGKQPFFVCDFFARGATETKTENIKNIYYGTTTYTNALGTLGTVPNEMMPSPMTPFAWSTRAQSANYLSYDGKSAAPVGWVASQRLVNNGLIVDMAPEPLPGDKTRNGNNAFWGTSVKVTTGQTNVILFPIPRRPMLSLSQLGSAATSEVNTDPDLTIGSSFANPGIKDLSKITDWPGTKEPNSVNDPAVPENGYVSKITSGDSGGRVMRYYASVRTDAAFASNLALWDSYWFSGLNTQAKSYSDSATDWPGAPNLPTDSAILVAQAEALKLNGVTDLATLNGIKAAMDKGYNPLANKRVAYRPDPSIPTTTTNSTIGMQNTIFPDYLTFPHPTFLGRRSLYDGGFNVNSTSKAAWKAVLGGLKGQKMPDEVSKKAVEGTPLSRFARAFGGSVDKKGNDGANKPWECYHDITDGELDALAGAVVSEVRRRGPFMSLSDFVNRRLINDDNFGLKGALQAAIDATDINDDAIDAAGGTFATEKGVKLDTPYLPIDANDRFPSARAMSNKKLGNSDQKVIAGLGAPGIISQMDILNSVGPNLTARSDTFVIRAYGEAFDNNGNSIGKAWVEVVTQRSTDFLAFTDQAAQSLKVSAEPTVRDQTYRNNDGTSKSDYDTKAILDKYRRNNKANAPTMATSTEQLINLNRILGRRFNAVSLRWLNPQDI